MIKKFNESEHPVGIWTTGRKETYKNGIYRIKKFFAIELVVLQGLLLSVWYIVEESARSACHVIQQNENGGYFLAFDPSAVGGVLLQYSWILIALIACLGSSVAGLILILRKKSMAGGWGVALYAVTILSHLTLIAAFYFVPSIRLEMDTSSCMFFKYFFLVPFSGERIDLVRRWGLNVCFALRDALIASGVILGGILCAFSVDDVIQNRKKRRDSDLKSPEMDLSRFQCDV